MFFLVEFLAWTLCAEVVLTIQHLLGCYILGETSQRRYAPVPKLSQSRAWISIREWVSRLSPNSVVYFFFLYKLIIFKSIIQFFFMLFPLLLCLHQHVVLLFWGLNYFPFCCLDVAESFGALVVCWWSRKIHQWGARSLRSQPLPSKENKTRTTYRRHRCGAGQTPSKG